ncbi:MAG: tyrosine-type recombinase/integrase [Ignavibacteria bacterium]
MAQYLRNLKKGNRWWFKFSYQNKIYFSKAIYLSKIEAKRAEYLKYEEVSNQARNPSVKPILELLEAINERLDYIKIKKSKAYYRENKRYYSGLYKHFGNRQIEHISKSDITKFLLQMSQKFRQQGKGNYAVNAALRIYKALFQMMIKNHNLDMKNPCVGIDFYPIEKRIKYIPTDQEIKAVKNICDAEERLLIDFIIETGSRISEAIRVKGKDIGNGYVVLYTRKSKNSNLIPRKVPCKIKLPELKLEDRLFSRWSDTPRFIEKKVSKLGQHNWSHHNLRHRFASLLSKEGKPLFEIMLLLGHSNLETTQLYLQLIQ